jgi:hypothetical protein
MTSGSIETTPFTATTSKPKYKPAQLEPITKSERFTVGTITVLTWPVEIGYQKKPCSTTGEHPTCLIVPAQNFTSAFPKMGYLAIRRIIDSNKVNYSKRTIIQASDLKAKLDFHLISNKIV